MHIMGFDIGGTKCAVFLCRLEDNTIIWKERKEIKTTSDWREVLDTLCVYGERMLETHEVCRLDCRIGISCGGPLSPDRMVICSPPNLPGWVLVPIVSYLSDKLQMTARMLNDADACALAEWKYGAGKGSLHMIFLTFGTGLGAGLILNGRLYTGACGLAGEVGHIVLRRTGRWDMERLGVWKDFAVGAESGRWR